MILYFWKELAEAVRLQTNRKILGSNPAALNISFLKLQSQVIGETNTPTHFQFTNIYTIYDFYYCLCTYIN